VSYFFCGPTLLLFLGRLFPKAYHSKAKACQISRCPMRIKIQLKQKVQGKGYSFVKCSSKNPAELRWKLRNSCRRTGSCACWQTPRASIHPQTSRGRGKLRDPCSQQVLGGHGWTIVMVNHLGHGRSTSDPKEFGEPLPNITSLWVWHWSYTHDVHWYTKCVGELPSVSL